MLKKLGKKIANNFGLKILAGIFAIALWIVVVNIDEPTVTKPYTTSITIENADYITDQDKYFEALEGKNTVTFNVTAKRNVHDKLSNSDFTATANMEKIEYNEKSGIWRVPVSISTSKYGSSDLEISSKQLYMEVMLEDLGKVQKAIVAETKGTVADGCALGSVEIVGSNLMKIQGPSSIVSQIDTVKATINVEGMSTDLTDSVVPVLYDADGNVIDTTKLKLNISTVTIAAQILNTKDVALEFKTTGSPADGYMVTGIEYEPQSVRIKGEAATLNPVNKISIPEEVLDVAGATGNIETTVNIASYLPSGISLVLNSDGQINVTVKIEQIVTKTFEVPVTNLTMENVRDGYAAEFVEDAFRVDITGAKSAIDELQARDILGVVDAEGVGRGEHAMNVTLQLDEERYQVTALDKIPVVIAEKTTSDRVEESTDDENAAGEGGVEGETTGGGTAGTAGSENTTGGTASGESEQTGSGTEPGADNANTNNDLTENP